MRIYLTCLLVCSFLVVSAQVTSGTLSYHVNQEFNLVKKNDEAIDTKSQEIFKELRASGAFDESYDVRFAPDGFTYVEHRDEDKSNPEITRGGVTIMVLSDDGPGDHYYTDTKNGKYTNSIGIYDRQFLVSDTIETLEWELTDAVIPPSDATLGFRLLTATTVTAQGDTLVAAYAPAIPVQVGPKNYYGLPGAIIQLDEYKGNKRTSYTARKLEISATILELTPPTEGKKVDNQEFNKIRERVRKNDQIKMMNYSRRGR